MPSFFPRTKNEQEAHAGFSLAELLIALFIIAVLIMLLLTVIDPEQQFAMARNREREQHLALLASGVSEYVEDIDLSLLAGIPAASPIEICASNIAAECNGLLSLIPLLNHEYLLYLPRDPSLQDGVNPERSGYFILRIQNQHLLLTAPGAELGEAIEVRI